MILAYCIVVPAAFGAAINTEGSFVVYCKYELSIKEKYIYILLLKSKYRRIYLWSWNLINLEQRFSVVNAMLVYSNGKYFVFELRPGTAKFQ